MFVQSGHIAGTRIRTELLFSQNSDGRTRGALIERPFYALDTHWAAGVNFMDNVSVNSLERTVKFADRFQAHAIKENAWVGWSEGLKGRWVKRYTLGFTRDVSHFLPRRGTVPSGPSRPIELWRTRGSGSAWKMRLRRQETATRSSGPRIFSWGPAFMPPSATRTPFLVPIGRRPSSPADTEQDFTSQKSSSLLIDSAANGRYEAGSVRDAILGARSLSYVRLSENWLAFSCYPQHWGIRLDPDHELLLGGENGLRGYPRNYQAGDRSALFTLEGRYYTELYPFRLFRIGGAAFYDMGRAWGGAFANPRDPASCGTSGPACESPLRGREAGTLSTLTWRFPLMAILPFPGCSISLRRSRASDRGPILVTCPP